MVGGSKGSLEYFYPILIVLLAALIIFVLYDYFTDGVLFNGQLIGSIFREMTNP